MFKKLKIKMSKEWLYKCMGIHILIKNKNQSNKYKMGVLVLMSVICKIISQYLYTNNNNISI